STLLGALSGYSIHDGSEVLISLLVYIIGGDGTKRGASVIFEDIDKSFGFDTAVEDASRAINAAHAEAESCDNGIGPDMLSFSPTIPFPSCLSDLTPYQNENVPKEDIMEEASSNDDDFWTCPVYSRYEEVDMDKSTIEVNQSFENAPSTRISQVEPSSLP
ncbi:hypothetical protein Dimus_031558, partial [Dionaea muscipula]